MYLMGKFCSLSVKRSCHTLMLYHRWFKYSRYGTPIGETKIIAVKTPLKQVSVVLLDPCNQLTSVFCRPSTMVDLEGKYFLSIWIRGAEYPQKRSESTWTLYQYPLSLVLEVHCNNTVVTGSLQLNWWSS